MKKLLYIFLLATSLNANEFIFLAADSDTVAFNIGAITFWGDSGVVVFDTDTSALDTGRYIIPNWLAFLDSTHEGLFFLNLMSPYHFYLDTTDTNIYLRQAGLDSIYLNELDDIAHLPLDAHYPMDMVWRSDADSSWEYVRFGEFLDSVELNIDGGDFWRKIRGRGLYETTGDTIIIDLQSGSGLSLLNAGLALGTPSSLTAVTTNSVSGTTHTHAVGSLTASSLSDEGDFYGKYRGRGLYATPDSIIIDRQTNHGLSLLNSGLALGTPSTITAATSNAVTGSTHTHALTETGDISSVVAGTGLTGGGTSGDVTLNAVASTGLETTSDSIKVKLPASSGLTSKIAGLAMGTPSTLTAATSNAVTGTSHTHAVTGFLTGNQTITLSGDVTGSGTTAITTTIADNSVDGTDIAIGSDAQGDVYYYDGTNVARLGYGTAGYFLKTMGVSANPTWAAEVGDIEGVVAGAGLSGTATSGTATIVVNAGLGIQTTSDSVAVKLRTDSGLSKLDAGLALGTPGTITAATSNAVTGASHTHALTETGDISGVTAGAGLTGGGTSGAVTLDVIASTGLATVADSVKIKLAASSGLTSLVAGLALDGTDARNYNWTNETHNLLTTGSITSGSGGHIVTGVGTWTGSTLKRAVDNAATYILAGTAWDQGAGLEYYGGEHATTPGRVKIWYGSHVDDLTATDFYLARKDNGAEIDVLRADINGDITIYDALTTSGQIRAGTIGAGTTWNGNSISSAYLNITADKGLRNNSGYLDFLINSTNFEWANLAPSTYELKLTANYNEIFQSVLDMYNDGTDYNPDATSGGAFYPSATFDGDGASPYNVHWLNGGLINVPLDYVDGTSIYFAIIYLSGTTTDDFKFTISYYWTDFGEASAVSPSETSITRTASVTTEYIYKQKSAAISGSGKVAGSMISYQVERDSDDAADTYTGDVDLIAVGIIYQSNKLGATSAPY